MHLELQRLPKNTVRLVSIIQELGDDPTSTRFAPSTRTAKKQIQCAGPSITAEALRTFATAEQAHAHRKRKNGGG